MFFASVIGLLASSCLPLPEWVYAKALEPVQQFLSPGVIPIKLIERTKLGFVGGIESILKLVECPRGKRDCGVLGHPEICCPSPPKSTCLQTNNTLTGVYCCFSPHPSKQPCDDRDLKCEPGFYECPAEYNGGCCRFGEVCELTKCVTGIPNAPSNQDDLNSLYGIQPPETTYEGVGPQSQTDWVNDPGRLGDDESRALEGARITVTVQRNITTWISNSSDMPIASLITVLAPEQTSGLKLSRDVLLMQTASGLPTVFFFALAVSTLIPGHG